MADTSKKDLDFDELHQAVNALMDQSQKGKPAKRRIQSEPKLLSTNSTPLGVALGDDKKTTDYHKDTEDTRVAVTVRRTLPALTTHRGARGRAMDVVGPRPAPALAPPSAQPKREAASLKPSGALVPERITPIIPPTVAGKPESEKHEPSDDVLASLNLHDGSVMKHQKNEWPDPLDVHGFKDENNPESKPAHKAENLIPEETGQTRKPEEIADKQAEEPQEKPADENATPFLATKVEKRPLGAYASTSTDKAAEEKPEAKSEDEQSNEKIDTPSPLPAQQQPEELRPEVVAVESAEPESRPGEADEPEASVDDLRHMAIPQQYKESEKASPTDARPVFDTKEYHTAIETHASARHSSLGSWIMGITLLILLIVALGVAYYLITGSLDFSALFTG